MRRRETVRALAGGVQLPRPPGSDGTSSRRDEERQERTELRRCSLKFEGEALLKPAVPEATDHLLGTHHADHDGPVAGQALYDDVTRLRHSGSLVHITTK